MFLQFKTQEERIEYGGSAFVEIQFCKLPQNTAIKDIVAVSSIKNWLGDSLYINDYEEFEAMYSQLFGCGIYNNLESGLIDIYGINYYKPSQIDAIIRKINEKKPKDYTCLANWLMQAKAFNGFYILGV